MHSRNARTSIFPTTAYQLHAGAKRSTRCCLLLFAFFAANMCRMIFTRGFRQKEKSIATESGYRPFCLHSNMVAPGISRVRLISQFSGEQPGSLSVLMILPDSLRTAANPVAAATRTRPAGEQEKSTIRTIYSVRVRKTGPCVTIEFDGDGFLYKMVRLIIGALVTSALGKVSIENVAARLNSGQVSTPRFVAPAEGLSLVRVRY